MSPILGASFLYLLTTAGFCGTMNSYDSSANEEPEVTSEETEGVSPANQESVVDSTAKNASTPSYHSTLNNNRGGNLGGGGAGSGASNSTPVNQAKIAAEEKRIVDKKKEDDKKNDANNKKPPVKVVHLSTFSTINNAELNSGNWLSHCPWTAEAEKHKTYALELYKTCGVTSKGGYLSEIFDPAKNTIPVILAEIEAYEKKQTPTTHETKSYLRRLAQLKSILGIKNSDGSKRYVKNGGAHSIPVADGATLETEIDKSIAAKPGMHPLYGDPEEKLTVQNLKKTRDAGLAELQMWLTEGNKEKGKTWNKERVKGMIRIIELVRAEDEASLKGSVADAGDYYAESRKVLKYIQGLGHEVSSSVDSMKLVTLSLVSVKSKGEFALEMF